MSKTSANMTIQEIDAETNRLRALSGLRHAQAEAARERREAKWFPLRIVGVLAAFLSAPFAMAAIWIEVWKALGVWR